MVTAYENNGVWKWKKRRCVDERSVDEGSVWMRGVFR